ncbi:MAG: response regulator [Deltaproteobacteria bacterium HGW-Deltaproteobacteria-19]|jgi:two-component system chemotaxis response regulator CheY|nr:MAG: response regulator [Deltaproteobacteria bacterium HGW-Deltaproteobacteria-19]
MSFNILITDDSLSMRAVIRKVITLSGIPVAECFEAANGRQALEILSQHWVDVIISDINMPEMNGMELLKELKQDHLFQEIPVIIVSTEGNRERIEEAERMGAQGFLKKPFVPEELRTELYRILGLTEEGTYQDDSESCDF